VPLLHKLHRGELGLHIQENPLHGERDYSAPLIRYWRHPQPQDVKSFLDRGTGNILLIIDNRIGLLRVRWMNSLLKPRYACGKIRRRGRHRTNWELILSVLMYSSRTKTL